MTFELQDIQTVMAHFGSHKGVFIPYVFPKKCRSLRSAIGMPAEDDGSDMYYSASSPGKNRTLNCGSNFKVKYDYFQFVHIFIFR